MYLFVYLFVCMYMVIVAIWVGKTSTSHIDGLCTLSQRGQGNAATQESVLMIWTSELEQGNGPTMTDDSDDTCEPYNSQQE